MDNEDKNTPYYGDLEKTNIIANLLAVAKAERDQEWNEDFLENIPAASFKCGDPQLISGPDGFPYFQLFLPEPGVGFQCYVIEKMKDDFLLEHGYGIVFNLVNGEPDYVLSYGDILNLHLNQSFYTEDSVFTKATADEVIKEDEQVMVGQPNETILPQYTKKLLGDYLRLNGVNNPKLLLMMRKNGEKVTQDIVFNVAITDFETEEMYRAVMRNLSWYMPRHYAYVGMDEETFPNDFSSI